MSTEPGSPPPSPSVASLRVNRGRAKNWCFTLNNYTNVQYQWLQTIHQNRECMNDVGIKNNCVRYLIFGKEVGESGTPHLQGFISFENRLRLAEVRRLFQAHFEVARNPIQAIQYCKKEGEFLEFGLFKGCPGKRSDLEEFKETVKSGVYDLKALREFHSDIFAKYPRFCHDYL